MMFALRTCATETEFFSKLFRNRVLKSRIVPIIGNESAKKLGFSSCVVPSFKRN